ncbi:MAG: phage major capsid protein [Parcubacteria group bacterium]|nr:phage major capsid protein [Parcubacteria group bacterium]|tara:strand:- start:20587 stop:21579 length:993 start_codon:yes stop_codon:yes gene_type:complete
MQTLTQYEYLDRDMILRGVVDWLVKESPLLGALSMKSVQGNSLKYNVSLTLPTAAWSAVGDPITESTGTFEQRSTDIYTLIQNAYTDKASIALNATQNPEAIDAALAAQAMAHEFEKTLIIGQTSVDTTTKQFKGLLRTVAELESATTTDLDAINNDQVIAGTTSTGALTMASMDELVDQIKPGKPDLLLMSRRSRRKLNVLSRASGSSGLELNDSKLFGSKMMHYDETPIYVSDWLLDNYTEGSSSVQAISTYDFDSAAVAGTNENTIIFAMQIGEDKVTGLHAGEMAHERGTLVEDYNAILNRYVWYVGLACFKKFSLACMTGTNPRD